MSADPVSLTEEAVEKIAERASELAIQNFFIQLGVDSSDPLAMQKDFAYLRAWRESIDLVKRRSIITTVSVIITGLLGVVLAVITHRI